MAVMIRLLDFSRSLGWLLSVLTLGYCVACAHSTPPVIAASAQTQEEEVGVVEEPVAESQVAEVVGPRTIPTTCGQGQQECLPEAQWVKALCQDVYPAVSLFLFQKEMPFTHAYLSRRTNAVNASGGATSGSEWLAFDEEVVLLYHRRPAAGGMQISGAGDGYDALRWDGSCVTLDASEVRLQRPPSPKAAEIPWRSLGKDMQRALKKNAAVKKLYMARKKECKGAFSGEVSKKCIQLNSKLNRKIVESVLQGEVTLAEPSRRP